jgi:hypothetical protein
MNGCGGEFWRGVRGAALADRVLPQLVDELRRLNDHLDRFQVIEQGHDKTAARKDEKP